MRKRKQEYEKSKPYKKRKMTQMPQIQRAIAASTETKYYDQGIADTAIAGTAATSWAGTELDPVSPFLGLFQPIQGTDITQRIGRKCAVKSIKMNITTSIPAVNDTATARAGAVVRYILYQDMQTNGAQAQGEDVMLNNASTVTGMTADLDFMSLAELGRFKILWDKRFVIQDPNFANTGAVGTNTYDANGRKIVHKVRHKFTKPVIVNFRAATTEAIANVVDNSFHFIGVTDNNALTPTCKYVCRVSFKDS